MTIEEAISQLRSLEQDAQSRAAADPDEDVWRDDITALNMAIAALRA